LVNNGVQLRVKGKVQGVGFRPYVWQIAQRLELKGDVCNDAEGVLIRLLASETPSAFESLLYTECPPLAKIEAVICQPFVWAEIPTDFTIRQSNSGKMDTQVIPDAATCDACRSELFDRHNRRYAYPFINCTHCGPRFTIIKKMPYDRPNTSMADFPLCPECLAEYRSPADRRFHAQPNACPVCGPEIWTPFARNDEALNQIAKLILKGKIVAIKGLGGFHLACDATNDNAVSLLRQRKQRPTKPLAVMLPNLSWLSRCAQNVSDSAIRLLTSSAAPIVLVDKAPQSIIRDTVAPGLNELGVMLPSNPLQHLLATLIDRPLVMTSGNASGKPPALTNHQAVTELSDIADNWLLHNRDIVQRADDSLLRCNQQGVETLRRARGYVPDSFILPDGFESSPAILAIGADLKNTFCLLRDKSAVLGPHLGDLDDIGIQQQFNQSLQLFQDIYTFTPEAVIVDAHSGYVSQRMGRQLSQNLSIPVFEVLHHHAHIASCLAEHGWHREAGPVIGLAFDGLGMGDDGHLWGGECLLADYQRCRHIGGLPAVALPGGNLASRQPWRNLAAHMIQFVPDWRQYEETQMLLGKNIALLQTAIARNLNSPPASSIGRLFDAVAAALGICFDDISWEGEAACQLEALASHSSLESSPVTMPLMGYHLDLATFWQQWLNFQASPEDKAFAFHFALAQGGACLARAAAKQHGIDTIVLCGGVMHNRLLRALLLKQLTDFNVLYPQALPMGDGGLALGQAVIGVEKIKQRRN
jgi:hydrogenase maturation protein HypF